MAGGYSSFVFFIVSMCYPWIGKTFPDFHWKWWLNIGNIDDLDQNGD